MPSLINIVVIDTRPLFRHGMVQALSVEPKFQIAGEASHPEEALRIVRALNPSVVLLDGNLPANSSLETAEKITLACPATAVLLTTDKGDQTSLMAAFKVGARGYMLKDASARDLIEAVHAVAAGKLYVSPSIAALLLTSLTHNPAPDPFKELTERERGILRFISAGMTNREIGERVFLSEKTIKHYVTSILQKLQVRSRVQAALFASRQNYNY